MKTGRLLRLQRKVGMKKNEKTRMQQFIEGSRCITTTSMYKIAAKAIIVMKGCGSFPRSISFLLISRNFSSSVKVIIPYFLMMIGIPMSKKTSRNIRASPLPICPAIEANTDKAKAKRIFQRLISVFNNDGEAFVKLVSNSGCLVKSSMSFSLYISFEFCSLILSHLQRLYKGFVKLLVTFVLFLGLSDSTFAFTPQNELDTNLESSITSLIRQTERKYNIPKGLLASIAKVESGNNPFAINVSGKAYFASSIEDAKEYITSHLKRGIRNIDVGVMQINMRWHGKEFEDISQMLSLNANIEYAGKLLASLSKSNGGDWHKAVRYYHSSNPVHYRKYSKKVVSAWLASI